MITAYKFLHREEVGSAKGFFFLIWWNMSSNQKQKPVKVELEIRYSI